MHSIQFEKHEFLNAFPEHVRDKCLRAYEEARRETARTRTREKVRIRDEHAEEIWDDQEQKARWTYERQHDA
jgi:hypothetical protein